MVYRRSVIQHARVLGCLAVIAALSACAIPVKVDYNASEGLERCHSYAWQQSLTSTPSSAFDNPLNQQRLRSSVAAQLSARGMVLTADPAQADCLVGTAIGARNDVEDTGPTSSVRAGFGFGFGSGWRFGGAGLGLGYDSGYVYHEGGVSVDFFDAHSHDPLWHAVAQRDVTDSTGAYAEQRIDQAVKALFAKFPLPAR